MTDSTPKKERAPRKRGIRYGAQAFCKVCGWEDAMVLGKGATAEAAKMLAMHREKVKCK